MKKTTSIENFIHCLHKLRIVTLCAAALGLAIASCETTKQTSGTGGGGTSEPRIVAATPAAKIGDDLHTAVAQATQAYVDAKGGNTGWAWSASQILNAYKLYTKSSADVKEALATWNDGTKAGQMFAEKVAKLFAASTGTPAQKVETAIAAVQEVAADKGP